MAEQIPMVEVRMLVTEDVRLKLEVLKNRLEVPNIGDVLTRGAVILDYVINVERQGGKILIDLPGHGIQRLNIIEKV